MKNIFAVFSVAALLLLSGCAQPTGLVGDPYTDEPRPHEPTPHEVTDTSGSGVPGTRDPGWGIWVWAADETQPPTDAVLNLDIKVEGAPPSSPPFGGEGWMFRLHLLPRENGTVEVPPDADWFRTYTLQGEYDKNIVHHTSFPLGDLKSERIFLRLTYHNIHAADDWEAWESTFLLQRAGDDYEISSSSGVVCRYMGLSICPWSGQNGTVSPPPPDVW